MLNCGGAKLYENNKGGFLECRGQLARQEPFNSPPDKPATSQCYWLLQLCKFCFSRALVVVVTQRTHQSRQRAEQRENLFSTHTRIGDSVIRLVGGPKESVVHSRVLVV